MSKEKMNARIKEEMKKMEETDEELWLEADNLPPLSPLPPISPLSPLPPLSLLPPAAGEDEACAAPAWIGTVPIITEQLAADEDQPSEHSMLYIKEAVVLVAEPYKNPDDTDADDGVDLDEGIEEPEPDEVAEEAMEDAPEQARGDAAEDAPETQVGTAVAHDGPTYTEKQALPPAAPEKKIDTCIGEMAPTPGSVGGAIPRPRRPSPPPAPAYSPPDTLLYDELEADRARIVNEIVTLFGQKSDGTLNYIQKEIESVKNLKCDTVAMFKMLKILETVVADLKDMQDMCRRPGSSGDESPHHE